MSDPNRQWYIYRQAAIEQMDDDELYSLAITVFVAVTKRITDLPALAVRFAELFAKEWEDQ